MKPFNGRIRGASLAAGLLAVCLTAPLHAEEKPRTVTVSGTGSATAEPDRAQVSMAVQKSDASMARARDEVVAVTRKFIALTQRLGIDPKKIRTSGLNARPEYAWDPKTNRQIRTGYLVQRDLEVELDDLQKLGEIVEGAVDAGVNQVSPPQLGSRRESDLNREALREATRDAQANARTIADALGMKLGAAREITAANPAAIPPPVPMVRAMVMKAGAPEGGADTYSTGLLHFEAQVTAVFDLGGG